jgi:hypothetical protein
MPVFAQLGPEPLRMLLSRRDVAEHRNLFCRSYDRCLDKALECGWVSWTCVHCVRFVALRRHEAAAAAQPV